MRFFHGRFANYTNYKSNLKMQHREDCLTNESRTSEWMVNEEESWLWIVVRPYSILGSAMAGAPCATRRYREHNYVGSARLEERALEPKDLGIDNLQQCEAPCFRAVKALSALACCATRTAPCPSHTISPHTPRGPRHTRRPQELEGIHRKGTSLSRLIVAAHPPHIIPLHP